MQYSIEKSTLTSLADAIRDMDIRRNATTDPEEFVRHNFISQAISPTVSTIRAYAFSSCYNLEVVEFPAASYVGSHAFASCSKLSAVNLATCTEIGESAFWFTGDSITFNLGEVTTLGDFALHGSNVIDYGARPYAFSVERGPGIDLPKVTSIGKGALASRYVDYISLDSLTSLPDYSGWYYGDVTPFCSCYAQLNLPNLSYIGQLGFEGYCNNLYVIYNTGYASMVDVHGNPVSMFNVSLPKCEYVGSYAFSNVCIDTLDLPVCTSAGEGAFGYGLGEGWIETINLDKLSSLPTRMLDNCHARTINLPALSVLTFHDAMNNGYIGQLNVPTVKTWTASITYSSYSTFSRGMTGISIPACETLNGRVFDRINISSISLPAVTSIDYIDQYTRYEDQWGWDHGTLTTTLSSIYIGTSNCALNHINSSATSSGYVIPDIYVKSEYVEDYKVANNWSAYASKIFGY